MTVSQKNAIKSAESYLSFMGFSRQGLIDQLSSEFGEKFSVEDATFAVDSLAVDWNAEAASRLRPILDTMGFSCQGKHDRPAFVRARQQVHRRTGHVWRYSRGSVLTMTAMNSRR